MSPELGIVELGIVMTPELGTVIGNLKMLQAQPPGRFMKRVLAKAKGVRPHEALINRLQESQKPHEHNGATLYIYMILYNVM